MDRKRTRAKTNYTTITKCIKGATIHEEEEVEEDVDDKLPGLCPELKDLDDEYAEVYGESGNKFKELNSEIFLTPADQLEMTGIVSELKCSEACRDEAAAVTNSFKSHDERGEETSEGLATDGFDEISSAQYDPHPAKATLAINDKSIHVTHHVTDGNSADGEDTSGENPHIKNLMKQSQSKPGKPAGTKKRAPKQSNKSPGRHPARPANALDNPRCQSVQLEPVGPVDPQTERAKPTASVTSDSSPGLSALSAAAIPTYGISRSSTCMRITDALSRKGYQASRSKKPKTLSEIIKTGPGRFHGGDIPRTSASRESPASKPTRVSQLEETEDAPVPNATNKRAHRGILGPKTEGAKVEKKKAEPRARK